MGQILQSERFSCVPCFSRSKLSRSIISTPKTSTSEENIKNQEDMGTLLESGRKLTNEDIEETDEIDKETRETYLKKIATLENTIEKIKIVNKNQPIIAQKLCRDNFFRLAYLYARTGQQEKAAKAHDEATVLSERESML